ncbi:unnamed protein product, partial [Symbiodinium pilosum]
MMLRPQRRSPRRLAELLRDRIGSGALECAMGCFTWCENACCVSSPATSVEAVSVKLDLLPQHVYIE